MKHLTLYATAGFPDGEFVPKLLELLEDYPIDALELGVPFSDPVADGEAIQLASQEALKRGANLKNILNVNRIENHFDVFLMGYANPFIQFGWESLAATMEEKNIKGTIIPDIPLGYYESHLNELYAKYNRQHCFLVTPESTDDRIRKMGAASTGFLYAVSKSATTGGQFAFDGETEKYLSRIEALGLKDKTRVGFGISDYASAKPFVDRGWKVIIGSAFIRAIQSNGLQGAASFLDHYFQNGK